MEQLHSLSCEDLHSLPAEDLVTLPSESTEPCLADEVLLDVLRSTFNSLYGGDQLELLAVFLGLGFFCLSALSHVTQIT